MSTRFATTSQQTAPDITAREARYREREAGRSDRPPHKSTHPVARRRRSDAKRGSMRVLATAGIVGVAVLLGAILVGESVAGWIVGLVVGLTSVTLAGVPWTSRRQ
jgi:hypothetical protein